MDKVAEARAVAERLVIALPAQEAQVKAAVDATFLNHIQTRTADESVVQHNHGSFVRHFYA
jgi:hypothetical protein